MKSLIVFQKKKKILKKKYLFFLKTQISIHLLSHYNYFCLLEKSIFFNSQSKCLTIPLTVNDT